MKHPWHVRSQTFIIQVDTCNVVRCGKYSTTMQIGIVSESDFARDLEGSKTTSGGFWCIFGSHTFVPISWMMCKKQTSVSHSSTEAEIMSLDAGL